MLLDDLIDGGHDRPCLCLQKLNTGRPTSIGVRANIHLGGGGQTEFCPNGFGGGGGSGVVAEVFQDPYPVGAG